MLRLVPQEEVDRLAREEYARMVKAIPEPIVINVEELITLDAPRDFSWGGVGYRAPPLSFRTGLRLLVCANALRDLRTANAPDDLQRRAIHDATNVLRTAIHPLGRLSRFLDWRLPCPFLRSDPTEFEGLLRWLLFAPDQSPIVPPTERVTIDLIDGLSTFQREFPGLIGRRFMGSRWKPWTWAHYESSGYPISWAHYVYNMRHLSRVAARMDLRTATAARMAQVDKEPWVEWIAELRAAAGWS